MRIGILLLFLLILQLHAENTYSQDMEVGISLKNATVEQALNRIERETGYSFLFTDKTVDVKRRVNVDISVSDIDQALNTLFKGTNVQYSIVDKQVILSQIPTTPVTVQAKSISGVVTDSYGEPIIGANVVEKGTTNGTVTNVDGLFTIDVREGAVLQVSYIGYISKELPVGIQTHLKIILTEDTQNIEEVVVVGYGVQKKVNLTGAISTMDEKSIENRPLTNSTQALQGIQGVYVNQLGAQPGADNATIRVRGVGTLNDNDPLVLVDGIPSKLEDVNPANIANISVLKDAASSAIYGSRAANGVILVTTKTGEKDRFSVQYNNLFGVQQVTYLPDAVWDPILFMQGWNEAYLNEGKAQLYSDELIEEYRQGMKTDPYTYPATNWFDIAFRDAFTMEHNVRLSGGTEKLLMSMSIGYMDQEGVMIGTDNKKLTVNLNGTAVLGNLKAGMNVSGTFNNYNEPHNGAASAMNTGVMRTLPVFTPFLEDGRPGRSWLTTPGLNVFSNIAANVKEGLYNTKRTRVLGSIFAEYAFPFDINYKLTLAVNKNDRLVRRFQPIMTLYNPKTFEPQVSGTEQTARAYSYNNIDPSFYQTINWGGEYGKHDISALLGMSYEEFFTYDFNTSIQGFLDNTLFDLNVGSKNQTAAGAGNTVKLLSYFGRANYVYDNRYLFEANFRYDGSSRFAPKNRWGFFPSFSVGWRIDQEKFIEADWLSNLKLRASWGELGNQQIGIYKYVETITMGGEQRNSVFGNTISSGGAVTAAVDPNITWETTTITNAGLDFGFFNNSLSGSFEVFKKRTSDILRTVNIPNQIGNLSGPTRNIGKVDNTGFELGLNYRGNIDKFNYTVFGNLTYIKNEVVDIKGQEITSGVFITKEGHPIDSYYLYICDGIFQSEEEIANHATQSHNTRPGDLKFRDVDGDGVITEKDRVVTGKIIPDLTYMFGVNMEYKGVGLNLFFQGVHGVNTYPTLNLAQPYNNGAGVTYEWLEKAWREDNRDKGFPRLMTANSGHDNYAKNSTYWLKDASYLRLKNVNLSYTFPRSITNKVHLKGLKVFVNGENLLTFSGFKIFDPERQIRGTNLYTYPSVKSYTAGLNLTF